MDEGESTKGRSRRLTVLLAFAAVYVVWGSTYLGIRVALETLPPFLMGGVRFLAGGSILYLWARLRGAPAVRARHLGPAFLLGALLFLMGNGGVAWAQQYLPSGLAALLITMTPLWMVLLVWAGPGGERPHGLVLLGLALGLGGMVGLIGPRIGPGGVHAAGVLAVLGASLAWSIGSLYSRRPVLPSSPLLAAALPQLAGGVLMIVAGLLRGEAARFDPAAVSLRSVLALGYLLVFGSLVAFTAYSWLIRNVDPTIVSTYAFVNPVVAVVLGCTLGGEALPFDSLLAGAAAVAGVAVIITGQLRERPAPAAAVEEEAPAPRLCGAAEECSA
jgi:drug/metabolite transporter (DMT)-like permease